MISGAEALVNESLSKSERLGEPEKRLFLIAFEGEDTTSIESALDEMHAVRMPLHCLWLFTTESLDETTESIKSRLESSVDASVRLMVFHVVYPLAAAWHPRSLPVALKAR